MKHLTRPRRKARYGPRNPLRGRRVALLTPAMKPAVEHPLRHRFTAGFNIFGTKKPGRVAGFVGTNKALILLVVSRTLA